MKTAVSATTTIVISEPSGEMSCGGLNLNQVDNPRTCTQPVVARINGRAACARHLQVALDRARQADQFIYDIR